jgi:predicted nucleotidyltransferase
MDDAREADLERRGVAVSAMRSVLSASPCVDAAFVFGSLVRGGARHDSDLDIAVVLQPEVRAEERRGVFRELDRRLRSVLGPWSDRLDLVDLDGADSGVAFAAVRDGMRLFERSRWARACAVARTCRRYDDDAPRRRLFRRAAMKAAADMRGAYGES